VGIQHLITQHLIKEEKMSGKIDPEAMTPSTVQSFDFSDRNPVVKWSGTDADGGQIGSPAESEQRVTPEGPAVSPNAGLEY
jgi:hypothetical protein